MIWIIILYTILAVSFLLSLITKSKQVKILQENIYSIITRNPNEIQHLKLDSMSEIEQIKKIRELYGVDIETAHKIVNNIPK
jgi:hypothetical protein